MPSLTVENYLKAILQLTMTHGSECVSTGQLASAVRVSPGTVTAMLKTLSDSGLCVYRPYEGVSLTKAGRNLAFRMLRRHRLLESFLVRTLELTWDQVHEEAENMEHAVSDVLIDRIDAYLGFPLVDPHGDPIPGPDGMLRDAAVRSIPLIDCLTGDRVRLVRVVNQAPEFLRYLTEHGFEIGVEAIIESNSIEAGIVTSRVGDRMLSLGRPAASQIYVDRQTSSGTEKDGTKSRKMPSKRRSR